MSVGIASLHQIASETTVGYDTKAFMSLDGIFSPVSKKGSGGLPSFVPVQDPEMIFPDQPIIIPEEI